MNNRADYVDRVVTALCSLWSANQGQNRTLQEITTWKLNQLWVVMHRSFTKDHEVVEAIAFWSSIAAMYPSKWVYCLQACLQGHYDPKAKPVDQYDATRVVLYVQPACCAERIQIDLDCRVDQKSDTEAKPEQELDLNYELGFALAFLESDHVRQNKHLMGVMADQDIGFAVAVLKRLRAIS